MATPTSPQQDPRTVVKISTRLWSEEVGLANANEPVPPHDPSYQFSNGKRFVDKDPYAWAQGLADE